MIITGLEPIRSKKAIEPKPIVSTNSTKRLLKKLEMGFEPTIQFLNYIST